MSKQDQFELSRRKALAGIGGIGVASAGAGLGTSAYFSDQESFENNTMTAGELDLSVTWQQLYYGATQESRPQDYGSAGRPFVNAYPDQNGDDAGNGVQSFDGQTYVDLDDYEDPEQAAKEGKNLEFACEEIETFDDPSFDPNDEALFELDDVKPGDSGEATFGIKLCDNPGYIWMGGRLGEETDGGHPESDGAQLADEIQARVWYDLDGDNVYDEGEPAIVSGSLREVFGFLNEWLMLDYDARVEDACPPNGSNGGDGVTLTHDDCVVVSQTPPITCEDLGMFEAIKVDSDELPEVEEGASETYETDLGVVTITVTKVSEDDIREFDFELDGFEVDAVIVKGGPDSNVCQRTENDETLTASAGENLGAPFRTAEERYGVSNISFCYTAVPDDPPEKPPECFEPSNTRFIAFEWNLPTTVGNEVQGDSVAFDLGFYTEQCRHNDDPDGPSDGFGA